MKHLKLFSVLLAMLFTVPVITSCGDDEEDQPIYIVLPGGSGGNTGGGSTDGSGGSTGGNTGGSTENLIVGEWRCNFSTGYVLMNLGADGSGWEDEYDEADGGWYGKDYFQYTYDSSSKTMTIIYDDGDYEQYKVISVNQNQLVVAYIYNGELDEADTFYRVK
ncbi:MAG: hypothetical protein IJ341_00040 [Bacteroidales bacterium]|nr:hypothetical protein [Bacteroidales bacterium]